MSSRKSHVKPPLAKECTFTVHTPDGFVCRFTISCYDRYPAFFNRLVWQRPFDYELVDVHPQHIPEEHVRELDMCVQLAANSYFERWSPDKDGLLFRSYRTQLKGQVRTHIHHGEGRAWHSAEKTHPIKQGSVYPALDWRNYNSLDQGKSDKKFTEFCAIMAADIQGQLLARGWHMELRPVVASYDPQAAYEIEELIEQEHAGYQYEDTWESYRGIVGH